MKTVVLILVALISFVSAQTADCDATYNKCSECVEDDACGWCVDSGACWNGDSQGPTNGRECDDDNWIFAGKSAILSQESGFPVNPVYFSVYLYPGSPLELPVTVTNPESDDVPLDLYLVQDVSASMGDDIETLGDLTTSLVVDVLTYQANPQFGLASFGDMPMDSYGIDTFEDEDGNVFEWPNGFTMANARSACPERTATSGPYNWLFCEELALTQNYNDLQKTVRSLVVHVNGDWSEASSTALMYTGVCDMGWRENARKVVLLATDADWQEPQDDDNLEDANYECLQEGGNVNGLPGTLRNFPDMTEVRNILAQENIIPVIASANALPQHQDLPEWETLIKEWGIGKVFQLEPDSSNFITIVREALTDLSTSMVLQLVNDEQDHVNYLEPTAADSPDTSTYNDVAAGEQRAYSIHLLSDGEVIPQTIDFKVVGFGEVVIDVTNSIPCLGCDGQQDSDHIFDLCGVCLPPDDDGFNSCVGCDSVPFSGANYDLCGECLGDSTSCRDCVNVLFGTSVEDACGVCEGDGSSCIGCDGVVNSGLEYDNCGECNGNDACRGCDGILDSNTTVDECGVCGGTGLTCKEIQQPSDDPTPAVVIGVAAVLIAAILIAVAVILILGILGKKKFDEYQFMNNQKMSAVGANPLYNNKGGWHDNTLG